MERKLRIYLDLDDVLADFIGGVCRAWHVATPDLLWHWTPGRWGITPPLSDCLAHLGYHPAGWQLTEEEFWGRINGREEFWSGLDALPWAGQVVQAVKEVADSWMTVTSVTSKCPSAYSGKVKWLQAYFGKDWAWNLHLTNHKEDLARPGTVLIDDMEETVRKFRAMGGAGIVFPRHHNSLHHYKHDPVSYIRSRLHQLKETTCT